jgi:hypothetical protein
MCEQLRVHLHVQEDVLENIHEHVHKHVYEQVYDPRGWGVIFSKIYTPRYLIPK